MKGEARTTGEKGQGDRPIGEGRAVPTGPSTKPWARRSGRGKGGAGRAERVPPAHVTQLATEQRPRTPPILFALWSRRQDGSGYGRRAPPCLQLLVYPPRGHFRRWVRHFRESRAGERTPADQRRVGGVSEWEQRSRLLFAWPRLPPSSSAPGHELHGHQWTEVGHCSGQHVLPGVR